MIKKLTDEIGNAFPGLILCIAISFAGLWLGGMFPVIGAPVFAIIIGIFIGNVFSLSAAIKPGISFCSKKILQYAIIILGASLSLTQIWKTGKDSLWVMLISLSVSLLGAYIIGKKMGISRKLTSLVGVGTGICGGSAIAAVAPIINADDDEIAFSISTIFLFNVVAVLMFPFLGHLLHLQDYGFGLWAGTAINDTSSVVAAGYSYSKAAGDYAAITKLARTTMIIPVSFIFAMLMQKKTETGKFRLNQILPWFILGFLMMAAINTTGLLGPGFSSAAGTAGRYLIVVALAGVGLGADLQKMLKTGPKPVILGFLVWILVASSSLAMQFILKQI
ncbi:MAG: YeiH family protein [Firmicutes bacterium]|nr:YeiH family protein [Bacillota bacterium]